LNIFQSEYFLKLNNFSNLNIFKSEQFFSSNYQLLERASTEHSRSRSLRRWTDLLGRPMEASASGVAAAMNAASDVQEHPIERVRLVSNLVGRDQAPHRVWAEAHERDTTG
jgi:hypothetical protein